MGHPGIYYAVGAMYVLMGLLVTVVALHQLVDEREERAWRRSMGMPLTPAWLVAATTIVIGGCGVAGLVIAGFFLKALL